MDFLRFLRRHLWWWLTPILLVAACLALLSWALLSTPDSPFQYELR